MPSTTKKTPEGEAISEVAHAEGGTTEGSVSSQMQSQLTKERDAEQVEEQVGEKLAAGAPISEEEAK
jgi:hypothetical protein